MLCGMINGTGSRIFCRDARAMLGSRLGTTGCLSKRFSIAIALASPGAICRSALAIRSKFIRDFRAGPRSGVWKKVFEMLAADADNEYAMIDSTIVRAHQHSAGAKKRRRRPGDRT